MEEAQTAHPPLPDNSRGGSASSMTSPRSAALVLTLALATLPAASPLAARCRAEYEDDVVTSYRRLSWDDFKGRLSGLDVERAARVATLIRLLSYEVAVAEEAGSGWVARPAAVCLRAEMDKLLSGYGPAGRGDRALAHEQLHFDVTEVFARRLRARLAAIEERAATRAAADLAVRRRVEAERKAVLEEWNETQGRYDRETRNGNRASKQRSWAKQIREWLEETDE